MSIVAIIPARGGSKRIPRKNIKPFCGRPMIAYSIEAVLNTSIFDRIIVSTDDDEVMRVAHDCGAEAPFKRPRELCDDLTAMDPVISHALDWLNQQGSSTQYACCVHAAAPFLRPEDIREGLERLKSEKATTAFSVTTYPSTIFRALKLNSSNRLEMLWPQNFEKRSQDFEPVLHDAGQFYWLNVLKYLQEKRLFSKDSIPIVLPRHRVVDIDTPEDWAQAEAIFQANRADALKPE